MLITLFVLAWCSVVLIVHRLSVPLVHGSIRQKLGGIYDAEPEYYRSAAYRREHDAIT